MPERLSEIVLATCFSPALSELVVSVYLYTNVGEQALFKLSITPNKYIVQHGQ